MGSTIGQSLFVQCDMSRYGTRCRSHVRRLTCVQRTQITAQAPLFPGQRAQVVQTRLVQPSLALRQPDLRSPVLAPLHVTPPRCFLSTPHGRLRRTGTPVIQTNPLQSSFCSESFKVQWSRTQHHYSFCFLPRTDWLYRDVCYSRRWRWCSSPFKLHLWRNYVPYLNRPPVILWNLILCSGIPLYKIAIRCIMIAKACSLVNK